MGTTARRRSAGIALAIGLFALFANAGCNAIIGATDPIARQDEASVSESCVLNSDCTTAGQVCIFRVCSPPCHTDSDCADGSRCLRTDVGTACVVDVVAGCPNGECPSGSTCQAGSCRNTCGKSTDCLGGQSCMRGACVGTDPTHDPGLDAGTDSGTDASGLPDAPDDRTIADGAHDAAVEAAEDSTTTADSGLDAAVESGCGDTSGDVHNCGACGHDCTHLTNVSASGISCTGGRCVYQCAAGHADCADAGVGCETDITTSPNCGTCGATCTAMAPNCGPMSGSPGGYACQSGCPSGWILCGSTCVDPTANDANCGGCNMPCTTTQLNAVSHCSGNTCHVSCATGFDSCGGACVDEQTDDNHCGTCTTACTGGEHCSGGTCQCTAGTHLCGGQCVNNDTSACGPSCTVCVQPTGGTFSCNGTQCKQACTVTGDQPCNNACTDVTSDPMNCGMCGMACSGATPYCVGSGCVACTAGQTKCANSTQVENCTNGQWGTPTSCTNACIGTGVGSGCGGMCVPGTATCADNTHNETCGNNGVYGQPVACAVSSPSCANGNCAYYAGESGGGTITDMLVGGNVYATPITVTATAKLFDLGMFTTAAGSNVNIGVYSNTAQNTPGSLLTSTGHIATANGPVSLNVNPIITLSANTTYWIAAISQASITIQFVSGAPGVAAASNPGMWPSLPASFPSGGPFLASETPSFFAVLQNQ